MKNQSDLAGRREGSRRCKALNAKEVHGGSLYLVTIFTQLGQDLILFIFETYGFIPNQPMLVVQPRSRVTLVNLSLH